MTTRHQSLFRDPADLLCGAWVDLEPGGIRSTNPARLDEAVWSGTPVADHVGRAVDGARDALQKWSRTSFEDRARVLRRFGALCEEHEDRIADLLCDEVGKAMWECRAEAKALVSKVKITLDEQTEHNFGLRRVQGYEVKAGDSKTAACWFRPHGVMAVLGPFNFPMHLPNGHIIPALAMGNTVVFKPSDKAPACGQLMGELLDKALREFASPPGVVNLVQGGAENARALATHPGVDGILFTGSWPVGRSILEANLDRPGRIVALEMGGNNPAVVLPDADLRQAAIEIVRGAFMTAGQRCTCTRRLIVHEGVAGRLLDAIRKAAEALVIANPRGEKTFAGPLVTGASKEAALAFQKELAASDAEPLLEMASPDLEGHYLTPGIWRVPAFVPAGREAGSGSGSGFDAGCDEEVFGPLLRVSVVRTIDDAIEQANATRYGLAASIFTNDSGAASRFRYEARAGCVNVNCATAGASSQLPFGGLGFSGNHRPAGAYSLDYCAIPIAGLTEHGSEATLPQGMTFDDSWL